MDRPLGNRQMPVDGQTLGRQTDASGWTDPWATDRPLVDRQTVGNGQTFGQQTDRQAMDRPLVNRQTVRLMAWGRTDDGRTKSTGI
jgi:hypothetical protein